EGSEEGGSGAVGAGSPADGSVAAGGSGPLSGHRRVGPALIDEDEARGIEGGDIGTPRAPFGLVALGGNQRLFLSGQPILAKARDIVAGLRRVSWATSQAAQCSAKVASGSTRTCSPSTASCAELI